MIREVVQDGSLTTDLPEAWKRKVEEAWGKKVTRRGYLGLTAKSLAVGSTLTGLIGWLSYALPSGYTEGFIENFFEKDLEPPRSLPYHLTWGETFIHQGKNWADELDQITTELNLEAIRFLLFMKTDIKTEIENHKKLHEIARKNGVKTIIEVPFLRQPLAGLEYDLPKSLTPQTPDFYQKSLPIALERFKAFSESDVYEDTDIIQVGNESRADFSNAPWVHPEPESDLRMMVNRVRETGKKIMLTDPLTGNSNPDSLQQNLALRPDHFGITVYQQEDWDFKSLDDIGKRLTHAIDFIKGHPQAPQIWIAEEQENPWPLTISLPFIHKVLLTRAQLERANVLFSRKQRRNLHILTLGLAPNKLSWEGQLAWRLYQQEQKAAWEDLKWENGVINELNKRQPNKS